MYENITTKQLKELLISKINLIDVREEYEFNYGYIDGATNIPTNELLSNLDKYLNKVDKYYIICQSGGRSAFVCQMLLSQGYNVTNVLGGTSSWQYKLVR